MLRCCTRVCAADINKYACTSRSELLPEIMWKHPIWSSDCDPAWHACVLRSNPVGTKFSFANASAFTVALFSLATVLLCESKFIEDRAVQLARARATGAQCMEKTYGNPRAGAVPFWCNNLLSNNSTVDSEFLNFKNASVLHALPGAGRCCFEAACWCV